LLKAQGAQVHKTGDCAVPGWLAIIAAVVALFDAVCLDRWGAQEGELGLKCLKTVDSSGKCEQQLLLHQVP
jgi:hypothetical protein